MADPKQFDKCASNPNIGKFDQQVQGGSNHYCRNATDVYVQKGDGPGAPVHNFKEQAARCRTALGKTASNIQIEDCAWKAIGDLMSTPVNAPLPAKPRIK